MSRTPFEVLTIPFYRNQPGKIEYALLRRSDKGYWQGIAGGLEDEETPLEAAKREAHEEASIPPGCNFIALNTVCSYPIDNFADATRWGPDVFVVHEYSFGVEMKSKEIILSEEHIEYRWVRYDEAMSMLKWDSNKTALWELNERLRQAEKGT